MTFLFLFFFSFCCSDWPTNGLASSLKNSEKASLPGSFYHGVAKCHYRKFCYAFFTETSEIFHYAPLSQSFWPGYHWKDIFLLQNLSIYDHYFNERWSVTKASACHSWLRPPGKGVNGFLIFLFYSLFSPNFFYFPLLTIIVILIK